YVLEADVEHHYDALIIGASYDNSTNKWQWSDGSEMRYTNWAVGEPANIGSRFWCAYMRIKAPEIGAWRNLGCVDEQFIAICERESFDITSGGAPPPPNLSSPPPPVRCPSGWRYLEASNLCYA
ncbi:C-type mannose receptor 2-like, partial [Aphelenchoides avenae]